jgi:hypothetical protein
MKRSLASAEASWQRHRVGRVHPRWDPAARCLGRPSARSLRRRFVEFRVIHPCSIDVEDPSVPAGSRPGPREAIQLPRSSCHVMTLVACALPGFEWCSSVSVVRAASVRSGLRQGLHSGVRGGLRPGLEPSVVGKAAGWSAIEGSVALADSLGVVSGFGVDRDVGGPVRVALRGRLALATGLS